MTNCCITNHQQTGNSRHNYHDHCRFYVFLPNLAEFAIVSGIAIVAHVAVFIGFAISILTIVTINASVSVISLSVVIVIVVVVIANC